MHIPVLLHEVLEVLDPQSGEVFLDCNLNRAGHSLEIAKRLGSTGTLIGIDLDATALAAAGELFATLPEHPRICLMHENFAHIDLVLADSGIQSVDKILFDLGLSSQELDSSGRGFTFQKDEPLLMTYQSNVTEETLTAKDILNLWEEETLADIIFAYGGERNSRRIAKEIVAFRKTKEFETTFDLVECIRRATPSRFQSGKTHFATQTFQGIRIAVNDELGVLKIALEKAFSALKPGGRMAVITFHSLEDKIVKEFFKEKAKEQKLIFIHKKPMVPSREEIQRNPRARSSKLRTIQKI
ncbi:MAG: S-adenosyl-methyltransferase MraW, rRNA (cytosine1402-N4)-methyltransferase [Candidatus Parcubacteria bacterium]